MPSIWHSSVMQLHQALCVCSPHLDWCEVDLSSLSSNQTCCTEGTTPKPVWQGAALQCHSKWMDQRTYIPLYARRDVICPRTHPCLHSQYRSTPSQVSTHSHGVTRTLRVRVVASSNQLAPLIAAYYNSITLGVAGFMLMSWHLWRHKCCLVHMQSAHFTWFGCSKRQSVRGAADWCLLQPDDVECVWLHVDGSAFVVWVDLFRLYGDGWVLGQTALLRTCKGV